MNANQNWFNVMVEFRWTVKAIKSAFGVSQIIAQYIQETAWKSQADAEIIANTSRELIQQVGF